MAYNAKQDGEKWNRLHEEIKQEFVYPQDYQSHNKGSIFPSNWKIHKAEDKPIVDEKKLIGNADAKIWAEEFVKLCKVQPSVATDEGTMIGWFANAIMAGYDKGRGENNGK